MRDVRGAVLQARIPQVIYGAADPKAGAVQTLYQLLGDPRLNHRCDVVAGVLAEPLPSFSADSSKNSAGWGKNDSAGKDCFLNEPG